MTATPQAAAQPTAPASGQRPTTRGGGAARGGRRSPSTLLLTATATVAAGTLLTSLPLSSIFTDWRWLPVSVLCAAPYLVVVAALRYRGPARWWHSLLGLLASVAMLIWVFVPQHLAFGVIPTGASVGDLRDLLNQAHQIMQDDHAPVPASAPLRLLVAAALAGLTCLTDVLGVYLRQPLLAAAPLLEVLAVASATSSRAASPAWFAAAAIGFLLILLAGTRLQDAAWGPSVDGSAGRLGGGRRMAIAGILAALLVPLLLPSVPTNLLARATHHDGSGDGSGGGGGQVVLSDLASLRGSLQRPVPTELFQVHVAPGDQPFYIKQEVDDEFTSNGWQPSGTTFGEPTRSPLDQSQFLTDPLKDGENASVPAFQIHASFTVQSLGGHTLPILADPRTLRLPGGVGQWNSKTGNVSGVSLTRNMSYTETVRQLEPTADQLHTAPSFSGSGDPQLDSQLLQLPPQPPEVTALESQLVTPLESPYDKAKAISDYFTDGRNGFRYSLSAPPNDGRNALVTFLDKKVGFCQQYAAAAAVLMRLAGVPARVVLGYTHTAPDASGTFTVTTADAHAWVEAYFSGIGWIPFDPTPLAGVDAGRAVALPWAPHPSPSSSSTAEPTAKADQNPVTTSEASTVAAPATVPGGPLVPHWVWRRGVPALAGLVLLALIGLGPRLLRRSQRRRRLERARTTGNPEPLWLELAATATDRQVLWPATVSVGQVPEWLGRHGMDERGRATLSAIAATVERDRFSANPVTEVPADTIRALEQALTRWSRRPEQGRGWASRWLPGSLRARQPRWRR
jgi:transglutaminase-like putative cysteine protease